MHHAAGRFEIMPPPESCRSLCTDYSHQGPRDNERDRESVGGSGVVVLRSSPGVGAAAASAATTGDCTTKDDDVLAAA